MGNSFFLFLPILSLWGHESISIQIDHSNDYAILNHFFKAMITDEEYGYVLEGAKPLSIRNFDSLDYFLIKKDFEETAKDFECALLVRKAIAVWNKLCAHQKNFALKAVVIEDPQSKTPALEVCFINIPRLNAVIDENIDLFRYVLGPTITTHQIVDKIAYSDELFMDSLQHNLTLVGIVLGFGSYNSVLGGRIETISALSMSRDLAPFTPQSSLMQSKIEHSLSYLTAKCFGCYFLELAGGNDSYFRYNAPLLRPSLGFANLEEEVLAIDAMSESLPTSLWQRPRFVFGPFTGGPSNQPLFDYLQKIQQEILTLLKKSTFLDEVLEKIGGKKARINCQKPPISNKLITLPKDEWGQILWSVAERFEDKKERSAFIEAFRQPLPSHHEISILFGDSKSILKGLQKALCNLKAAEQHFKLLAKKTSIDPSLKVIIPEQLYFKITHVGTGKELKGQNDVRLSYVIEDLDKNILFANCDTWLQLSQIIPGLAHGMQGMRVGEKRILFIHPVLAYGALTTLPPCIGLTIKVHLLDVGDKFSGKLPVLTPLDLEWIQDPALYKNIEQSIQQKPYFVGAFYRYLLNKIEELDKIALSKELDKQFIEEMETISQHEEAA